MGFKDKFLQLPIFGDAIRKLTLLSYLRQESIATLAVQFADILNIRYEFDEIVALLHREDSNDHYHNLNHAYVTFFAAIEGGVMSPTVTHEELPLLAIAALGHDLHHSRGQMTNDQDNIYRATNALRLIISESRGVESIKEIETAVKATMYPWRQHQRINYIGKILRDADMMANYLDCPVLKQQLFQGLFNEISRRTGMDPEQFNRTQKNFRQAIRWNTNWGSMKAVKHSFIARHSPDVVAQY